MSISVMAHWGAAAQRTASEAGTFLASPAIRWVCAPMPSMGIPAAIHSLT
jgi:hypothetical protein